MADRTVISAHTKPEISERLGRLAEATKRSKSFLAGEAIERYLAEEEAFIESVERGLAQADLGTGISSTEAKAVLADRLRSAVDPHRA